MTVISTEQEAVLTALSLKGQAETLKAAVEEADRASNASVTIAASQRDAAIARGRQTFENEQKQATEVYTREVAGSMKEPVAARERLGEAEAALQAHLDMMQKDMGISMNWLNPAPRGGRVSL